MNEKARVLIAAAEAFYNKGKFIQYDQRSMDRLMTITPRRNKYARPEEANECNIVFLDCSSFIFAVYYNAFAYELEADLTWHMADMVKPCVYQYVPNHSETAEEKNRIGEIIMGLLQPGDCLVVEFNTNGHIMLYKGDGLFCHCTYKDGALGYEYAQCKDYLSPHGAIYIDPVKQLFFPDENGEPYKNNIFLERVKRFCILRPLMNAGEPTEDAVARVEDACRLVCSLMNVNSDRRAVTRGEISEYKVMVHNCGEAEKKVKITASALKGAELVTNKAIEFSLPPSAKYESIIAVRIKEICGASASPFEICINGLHVFAERLTFCAKHDNGVGEKAALLAAKMIDEDHDVMQAISQAYAQFGIVCPSDILSTLSRLFSRKDSTVGDVLWRLPQQPEKDKTLYSFFGGTGVITPEAVSFPDMRTKKVLLCNLRAGDIIICSEDPAFINVYACIFTGEQLVGRFDASSKSCRLGSAQADTFLDSLLGKFCFIVLRPSV